MYWLIHQESKITTEKLRERASNGTDFWLLIAYIRANFLNFKFNSVNYDFYSSSFLFCFLTQVYVCPSLANLYENVNKNDWRLKYTGVPVLLHDKGSARSRAVPRVTFILAERGTCFALWQDTIDNLSSYRVAGPAFHTMCLSSGMYCICFLIPELQFRFKIY